MAKVNNINNLDTEKTNNRGFAEDQIDLVDFFLYLLRRWYLLIACIVIGAIVMGVATKQEITPMYQSQAMMFVSKTGNITDQWMDFQIGSLMTKDFVVISKSKPVIDTAIQTVFEKDGIQLTRGEAMAAISVDEIEETHIIVFTVTMTDPDLACDFCNAILDAMADQIAYILNSDKPTIVERAEPNPVAINLGQNNSRQVIIGGAAGFALCAMVLCIIYMLDDKIKTAEDIEKYIGATVLVSIPLDKSQTFKKSKSKKANKKANSSI
ncbi:MAG: Wzz/FepE/Etk N-terminal domain-containing protein [Saccharofermentans sp.]|nr:Wzz/FepE/Etk N-terminal domain-containing protein [Saccharofermentans sp.]